MGDCIECRKCFAVCTLPATFHSLEPLFSMTVTAGLWSQIICQKSKIVLGVGLWGESVDALILIFVNLAVNITCCKKS